MSHKVYDGGHLVEEWDDEGRTYRRFSETGELVEERIYTDAESESIRQREAEAEAEAATQRLRDQLAAGVADILAARAAAQDDRAKAESLRTQALEAKAATVTQRQAVAAFTPASTYSATQLGQVRNAIVDVLVRLEEIQGALAEFYAYRSAADANAVTTDNALLWLARLASGALED